jgi:MFS family permease
VGVLLVLIDPTNGIVLYVLFAVYGFSAYPIYAIAVAHANDFAKDGDFAKVAGGMLLVLGIGLAIGPAIAALVMGAFKPVGLFVVTATFHGALAVVAFLRMRIRPVRDADPRADDDPTNDPTVRGQEKPDVQVGA